MNNIKYEEEKINTKLLKLDKELKQAKNKVPGSSVPLRFLNESFCRKQKTAQVSGLFRSSSTANFYVLWISPDMLWMPTKVGKMPGE